VASPVDARVVQAQVGSFIQSARMVTADVELQKQAIFRVYGMLAPNDPALAKMTDYLNGNPDNTPFARAARETVSVEIASVIQQTKTSWQVDWTETERDRQGQPIQPPAKMRALVTIRVAPPSSATTEEQIKQNPLGVFVQDFSWSRTL
jgi:type IV secretion system protein VirB5